MNPFDEIAVEEAIRLQGKGRRDRDRRGLDRPGQGAGDAAHRAGHGRRPRDPGPDRRRGRAARRRQDPQGRSPTRSSPAWSSSASRRSTTISNQTGQMLAALLGWPQGTFASKVEVAGERRQRHPRSRRRAGDGQARRLPAIVTTDLRLNEPRYASLPNIMKAKSKPLATKTPADFGVDIAPRLEDAQGRRAGQAPGRASRSARSTSWSRKLKALGVAT